MRTIITLLRKDFALFFKDKAAVSLTFIVPIALIFVFGQIFGVNRSDDSGPSGIPLAVIVEAPSPAADALLAALKAESSFKVVDRATAADGAQHPLSETEARIGLKDDDYRFALILPTDLVNDETIGLHLRFLSNPRNDIETQMVNGLLQKTIFTNVPQLLGQSLQARARAVVGNDRSTAFNHRIANSVADTFGGDRDEIFQNIEAGNFGLGALGGSTTDPAAGAASSGATEFMAQIVNIETEQVAGQDVSNPMATRLVGGWAIQFLLFALSASAVALFAEKQQGLFQRLLSGPVSRAQILWSKFLYGVVLGLIQLVTLFFAGRLLYGIDVTSHLGNLVVVSIAAAGACTAFGMLLAAFAPTPEAARGLATFLILMMSAIGGAWFPTSLMPDFIQQLSKLTLVYWSMEGFIRVLWAGAPFAELLPILGILAGITVVVMGLATWRFNRGNLFD